MPMLDVYIPEGALEPDAEAALMDELTSILLRAEGADPDNDFVRSIAWAFLHRPTVYVGGSVSPKPYYRVVAGVPEGQLNGLDRKQLMVTAITEAVARAEGSPGDTKNRVWVFPLEIPEGRWGAAGSILGLADILHAGIGDRDKAEEVASQRLADSRAERGIG